MHYMMVSGMKTNHLVEEFWCILIRKYIQEMLTQHVASAWVYTYTKMAATISETGKMMQCMDKVPFTIQTDTNTRDNGLMALNMDMDVLLWSMVIFQKEFFKKVKQGHMQHSYIPLALCIEVKSKIFFQMGMVKCRMQIKLHTQGVGKMANAMEKVLLQIKKGMKAHYSS